MKTQAFYENGTMRSIEAAIVLSLVSFAGYTLLKPEIPVQFPAEILSMEKTVVNEDPFTTHRPEITANTVKPAEALIPEATARTEAAFPGKNYIASPERLAEFLNEEEAGKLEERPFSIPEWIDKDLASGQLMENELPLVTFSSNSVTDELNRIAEMKLLLVDEMEPSMEIEAWMTNESLFNRSAETMPETSAKSTVEVWKIQTRKFGNRTFLLTQTEDSKLTIEDWMTNENNWQAKQKKNSTEEKDK